MSDNKKSVYISRNGMLFLLFIILILILSLVSTVIFFTEKEDKLNKKLSNYDNKISTLENKISSCKKDKKELLNRDEGTKFKSIEELIHNIQPKLDNELVNTYAKIIVKNSTKYNIPPELVVCIIKRESSFNQLATSSANCVGLMQINPNAHKKKIKNIGIDNKSELFHIDNNIKLGCVIFKEYYDGDVEKALRRYVGGNHTSYIKNILSDFATSIIDRQIQKGN